MTIYSLGEAAQGDISDVLKVYPANESGSLSGDWTCQLVVLDADGTELLNRAVTDQEPFATNGVVDKFLVYLTAAETAALAVGSYRVVAELENLAMVPAFRREVKAMIDINEGWRANP